MIIYFKMKPCILDLSEHKDLHWFYNYADQAIFLSTDRTTFRVISGVQTSEHAQKYLDLIYSAMMTKADSLVIKEIECP